MAKKVCASCGRKSKLFESFEHIALDPPFDLCNECSQLIYKMRDDITDKRKDDYNLHVKQLTEKMGKKSSDVFLKWYKDYKTELDNKIDK